MFRFGLTVGALAWWFFGLWLATHQSEDPVVFGRYSSAYFGALCAVFTVALLLTAGRVAPIYRRLFPARAAITLLFVSTGASMTALELFVRYTDLLGVSYYAEAGRYHLDKIADESLVYRHLPNLKTEYQGVPVEINELGLRERPIGPKADGEFRILVLGDSVTFGWGVRAEQTFSRRLEAQLARGSGRPIRTINAGVGSYNTEQELAYLRRFGPELAADLVLLVYTSNDDEINMQPFEPRKALSSAGKSPPQVLRLLLGRSWTYRLFHHVTNYGNVARASTVNRAAPGWQRSLRALEGIVDFCNERGIPAAFFLYEHIPNVKTGALSEDIARVATARGVPFASTKAWLVGVEPRTLINSAIDSHPNATGHALVAQGMHDFLIRHVLSAQALRTQ